jgi:hypothetical protein
MHSASAEPGPDPLEIEAPAAPRAEQASGAVNYDGPPLVEVELDGTDYRIDPGKQGTALCISSRASGTWDWQFCSEARWDGSALRTKALDRRILLELSTAVSRAFENFE